MNYNLFLFLMLLFSAGCNGYQVPDASKAHPANPQASTSVNIPQTQTLTVDESNLPQQPNEMKKNKMKNM